MSQYNNFNDCIVGIENITANAINDANNAYNSKSYKAALNAMRSCLEIVCKGIIFYKEINDAQAIITINNGQKLNNWINIIGSSAKMWFDSNPNKNDNWKTTFHLVKDKGNLGSHPDEVTYRDCEECKVEFRKIIEWFYNTFLSNRPIPDDIKTALNNESLTPHLREKNAALHQYFTRLKNEYLQPVLNDQNGMTLDKVYIEPTIKFWEGCLKKEAQNEKRRTDKQIFRTLRELIPIHQFIPYFIEKNISTLEEISQPNAQLFLLLGYPGQGKTSFCKRLLHDIIEPGNLESNKVFFVKLRDISNARELFENPLHILYEYICKDINRNSKYLDQSIFDCSLLILDGLDELMMRENSSENEIEEFCKKLIKEQKVFPLMRIILTSRYGYVDLDRFHRYEVIIGELGRLSQSQQLSWLAKYQLFYPECKLTTEKIRAINSEQNSQYVHLKELIDQPILLHLVAYADMDISNQATRATIYTQLFDHIINRTWEKRQQIETLRELKDPQDLRKYIREIAFAIYQSSREYIRKYELEKLPATKKFIACLGKTDVTNALKYLMIAFYMQEIQKDVVDDDELDKRQYAVEFLHKSLQEYLVAEKIWEDLKRFLYQLPNKHYVIDTTEQALELVWNLFTPNLISTEIQEYLIEHIQASSSDDKRLVLDRMMYFYPELLKRHFLLKILPQEPIRASLYTFRGYYVALTALKGSHLDILFENDSKKYFVELLRLFLSNNFIKKQYWDLSQLELSESDLSIIDLSESNFSQSDLTAVYLGGSNLTETILSEANLTRADLSSANLMNANLRKANLKLAVLFEAILNGADLSNATLENAVLISARISYANLKYSNLQNVQLNWSDLERANLTGADLENANLEGVVLECANLSNANLVNANLAYGNLINTNLTESNLRFAKLEKANLKFANLSKAELFEAILINADLEGADFEEANLVGVNLNDAIIDGANFKNADLTDAIVLPKQLETAKCLYNAKGINSDIKKELVHKGFGKLFKKLEED